MSAPILTQHALDRAWTRFAWASDDLQAHCDAAWRQPQGLPAELPGPLRLKVMRILLGHRCRLSVRVFGGVLYLFGLRPQGWSLITVYPVTRAALFAEAA